MTIGGRNSQVPIGRKHSMPFNRPAQVVAPDVGNSTVGAGAFLAELRASWGEPDWFLAGTSMEKRGEIPARFSSSDYLIIYGNIAQHAATPDFFIDYALAGVPLFKGGIDLGMQTAPDLRSAFELVDRYSSPRLPFLRHAKVEYGGRVGIELVANGDLGPGRSIICEVPLLVFARLAGRYLGRPPHEAVIELRHSPKGYRDRYSNAAGCEVRYHAERDAITLPEELCRRQSMTFDADLWRTACYRCEEEAQQKHSDGFLLTLRSQAARFLAENGRPPRLNELAKQGNISSRTLLRRLRSQNETYQAITDALLRTRCVELLSQPNLNVSEVSERLGFADPSSFYRSFRRWFDTTPNAFRKGLQGGDLNGRDQG